MIKSKKLIICIDGLGYDLISRENTPFLYDLKEKGKISRLKTLFAFTGIEYSFFNGESPEKNGIWLEFLKSKNSVFNNKILKFFTFNKSLRTYFGAFLQLLKGRTYIAGLHNIPKNKLKYFDSSVENGLWKLPFFIEKNFVFYKWPFFIVKKNSFEKKKIIFKYETDEERLKRLTEIKGADVYYTQLMSIDKVMHKFGKQDNQSLIVLKRLDKTIEKYTIKFKEENENSEIILWSDHGFADVKNYIDIKKYLPKREDYLYFIAGTTISFWFENENAKEEAEKSISKIKELKKLTLEKARKYKIPFNEKYGDEVYFVEKGNYFFPNFYQESENEKFKSMHGYPDDKELDGFIFLENEKTNKDLSIENFLKNHGNL